jgi:hypothetical protein
MNDFMDKSYYLICCLLKITKVQGPVFEYDGFALAVSKFV